MRVGSGLLVFVLVLAAPAHPQQATERPSTRLLHAMGVRDGSQKSLREHLARYTRANPDVPHEFWQEIYSRNSETRPLMDALADVVEERFSPGEIERLLEFYASPLGEKLLGFRQELPEHARELGRRVADDLREQVRRELEARGYVD